MRESRVYLIRTFESDQGTQGFLTTSDGFHCRTLELPFRDNQRNLSCIPTGEYIVKTRYSVKYKRKYWITEVPNRSYILIHAGNFAGNKELGFKTHSDGCVLLGNKFGFLEGQRAILNSRITVKKFMKYMENASFKLHIFSDI